jgi:hypothetical protein
MSSVRTFVSLTEDLNADELMDKIGFPSLEDIAQLILVAKLHPPSRNGSWIGENPKTILKEYGWIATLPPKFPHQLTYPVRLSSECFDKVEPLTNSE